MIIRRIKLTNYRQYAGEVEFKFPLDKKNNITVIQGSTGAGKSCLYSSIHWALYDDDLVANTNDPRNVEGQLNTPLFEELVIGDEKKVIVHIEFGEADSTDLVVERSVVIKKTDEFAHKRVNRKFQIFKKKPDGSGMDVIEDSIKKKRIINNQFPKDISDLFFFDGEKLSEFFDPKKNKEIENHIKLATGVDIIEKAKGRLVTLRKELEASVKKTDNKDLVKVTAQLRKCEDELMINQSSIKSLNKKIIEYNDLIKVNESLQAEFSEVKEKKIRQSTLKDAKDEAERLRKEYQTDYMDLIIRTGPAFTLEQELQYFLDLAEQYDKDGKLPPDINPDFIKKLINDSDPKCICGTHIDKKMESLLTELANKESLFSDSKIYMDGRTHITYLMKEVESFEKKLIDLEHKIQDERKKYNKAEKEYEELDEFLRNSKDEKLQSLQTKIDNDKLIVNDMLVELGGLRRDETVLKNDEKTYNNKRSKLLKDKAKGDKDYKKRILIDEAINKFEEYSKTTMSELRIKLEKTTENLFMDMIWKKNAFDQIKLGKNYRFQVLKSGLDSFSTLSAGEGMTLAFSFIAALSSIAGVYNPLVIDTPIARIDDEGRDPAGKVISSIAKQLEGFQTTWLMTGREYSGEVKNVLDKRLGKYFKLHFEDDKTTLEEIQ